MSNALPSKRVLLQKPILQSRNKEERVAKDCAKRHVYTKEVDVQLRGSTKVDQCGRCHVNSHFIDKRTLEDIAPWHLLCFGTSRQS